MSKHHVAEERCDRGKPKAMKGKRRVEEEWGAAAVAQSTMKVYERAVLDKKESAW